MHAKYILLIGFVSTLVAGCGSAGVHAAAEQDTSCPALEDSLDAALAGTKSAVDFSFAVERRDGRRYRFERGDSTLRTSYESASTSKLVSAVVILRQVERGYLKLSDRPQDHIEGWPIRPKDTLHTMTLAQLLGFTSGLVDEPLCLNGRRFDFERCVLNIARRNAGNGKIPGREFFYAGTHLQVAGLMAVRARRVADWQALFAEFQAQTGLFANAVYDLPSLSNPRLAGGMHWNAEEYLGFLKALREGRLLNADTMRELLADRTTSAAIGSSPVQDRMGEDWRYGSGLWHECHSSTFNCTPGARISSPGAYGAYPFWDRDKDYIGIVARQGRLGTFPEGIAIERSVRSIVEQWTTCQ